MKVIGYGKAKEEDIINFSVERGVELPEDYKNFLMEYNGGKPENQLNYIKSVPFKRKIKVYSMFGISSSGNPMYDDTNIKCCINRLGALIQKNTHIPIAEMNIDGVILLILEPGMEGVYIYDYFRELKETKKIPFHKVCDTFTEFLDLIVPDEKVACK